MKTDKYGILASGPWIKPSGMLRHRIVLRVSNFTEDGSAPTEFVIHTQGEYEDGKHAGFSNGDYFPVRSYGKGGTAVMSAFEAAFKKWQVYTAEKCLGLDFKCLFQQEPVAVAS